MINTHVLIKYKDLEMKVTLEKEKENVVKLDITIPAKDAAEAYNKAVQKSHNTLILMVLEKEKHRVQ